MNASSCFTEGRLLSKPYGCFQQMESQQPPHTSYPSAQQTNMDVAHIEQSSSSSYHHYQPPPNPFYHHPHHHQRYHDDYSQYGSAFDAQSSGGYTQQQQAPYPSTSAYPTYPTSGDYYRGYPSVSGETDTGASFSGHSPASTCVGDAGGLSRAHHHLQYQQSGQKPQQSMAHQHTWYQPPLMPPEHMMMNMIQMTNRYTSFTLSLPHFPPI
ncbi:hypothetical protein DMENIID0001_071340 [Sergentomyia squamirostris]